ncbi:hypothetical protein OUY22_24185 [Nonomuraea sp. MCN248]|uniref:Uncharacterized protein n=1 Tax=Nonomuraea corallina TaxID=2989783 RepID=A0ABT4SH34_9ACTN|nr:hypothetical protein [Nonomuraea corallina]MDA0636526.1 hypothetical protein [Nonomuraea corallina]
MISINPQATQWLVSACRDSVRLVDGPARLRQDEYARRQDSVSYARAHGGAAAASAPVFGAAAALGMPALVPGAEVPTQPIAKRGVGPQPWRDAPVIT